jgi:hypothetical protein
MIDRTKFSATKGPCKERRDVLLYSPCLETSCSGIAQPALQGYGPKGKGFLDHVDVPNEVLQSHSYLLQRYPHLLRL